eukprot:35747_1
MAFTSRATRFGSGLEQIDDDVQDVGPGSYEAGELSHTRPSYAPFLTTKERDLVHDDSYVTPGPGSYKVEQRPVLKYNALSNSFVSRVRRFEDINDAENPGPGAYQVADGWNKRRNRLSSTAIPKQPLQTPSDAPASARAHSMDGGAGTSISGGGPMSPTVQFVRLPTAPSIPVPAQSFGYDENSTGDLVARNPAERLYTGKAGDTVGPAYYSPDIAAVRCTRATSFGASGTIREAFHLFDNPGPGEYEHLKKVSRKPQRQSFMFQSCMKRWDALHRSDTPGPGTYAASDGFIPKDEIPEAYQCFGSTSVRLRTPEQQFRRRSMTSADSPGPGAYTYKASDFTSRQEMKTKRSALGLPERSPFHSTSRRFSNRNNRIPGPGSYQTVRRPTRRRFVGRQGVFGSTARRFRYRAAELVPGPGSYHEKEGRGKSGRSAPSSVFVSTSRRFNKIVGEAPPVGSYDLKSQWIRRNAYSRSKQFLYSEKRFKGQGRSSIKARLLPGPGSYDLTARPDPHNTTSSAFRSHQPRFLRNRKEDLPGPGQYRPEGCDTLLKRSFNITIDGDEY